MKLALIIAMAASASACTFFEPDRSIKGGMIRFGDDGGLLSSDYDGAITTVSLPHELDPLGCGGWQSSNNTPDPGLSDQQVLSAALKGFYHPVYDNAAAPKDCDATADASISSADRLLNVRMRRNRVQDRIVMASNLACDAYKRHLLATQSVANYSYGNATLLTAGLGAILKPASTAQALSGAAAILSGSRAEYNDAFFRKLLAEVVTRGISVERQTSITYIIERQKDTIDGYSVEFAIADAINYNSKCTLIVGLENAQKSQSFYADPGLDRLGELYMDSSTNAAKMLQRFLGEPVVPPPVQDPASSETRDPAAPQPMRPPE